MFEAYDLLNEAADHLWPETALAAHGARGAQVVNDDDVDGDTEAAPAEDDLDVEESIEDQIARELEGMQSSKGKGEGAGGRPKNKARFSTVKTNTECLIWVACQPPCDPVLLTKHIVHDLQNGAPVRTRHLQRMTPVSATCHADADALRNMAYRELQSTFAPEGYTKEEREEDPPIYYRIEPNLRNHTGTFNRDAINSVVGDVVRDLTNPRWQYPVIERQAQPNKTDEPVQPADSEDKVKSVADMPVDPVDDGAAAQETSSAVKGDAEEPSIQPEATPTGAPLVTDGQPAATEQAESSVTGEEDAKPQPPAASDASLADDTGAAVEQTQRKHPILPPHRRRTYVDLKKPTHTILVSVLKGVCCISIVTGYDEGRKFNIQMLAERQVADKIQQKKDADDAAAASQATEAQPTVAGDADAASSPKTEETPAESVPGTAPGTSAEAVPETAADTARPPEAEAVKPADV